MWYNEASEALLRVEDAKYRMYKAFCETETAEILSDDTIESVVALETAWRKACKARSESYTELVASRGHMKIARYFASNRTML